MKRNNLLTACFGLTFLALLASCGGKQSEVTQIPFIDNEDGKWGMISTDGKVTFSNEFRNKPTVVTDDRFFVQNQDGFWEMYSSSEKPERIGGEFRYASPFSYGAAMVTPRDQPITIINTKGETIVELTEFDGKKVSWTAPFVGRNAIVACDTLQGVIDVEGKTIVAPKYSNIQTLRNGLIIADSYEYTSTHVIYDTIPAKGTQLILNADGKEKFRMDSKKYWDIVPAGVTDKYVTVREREVAIKKESDYSYPEISWKYYVLDYEGNVIVKPSSKVKEITAVRGELMIYSNEDDLYGVKSIDGKSSIKADFNGINFIGENFISAKKDGDESNDWTPKVTLFNNEGNKIGKESMRAVAGNISYMPLAGKNVLVEIEEGEWTILDAEGNKLKDVPAIFDALPYSYGDARIYTDKVEYDKFISGLKITPNSCGVFNLDMSPRQALEAQQKMWNNGSEEVSRPKASDYSWMKDVYFYQEVDGLNYSGELKFPQALSKQTFSERKVIDFTWGYTYWYHMEKVPQGYVFNNIKPSSIELSFNNWTFYGKLRPLYKALVKYCKKWGSVEDSNNGATLMNLDNGKQLLIALSEDKVVMKWGHLSSEDKWIGMYNGNAEKLQSTYDGNNYYKDTFTYVWDGEEGEDAP